MKKDEEQQELEVKTFAFNIHEFDLIRRSINTLTNLDSCGGNRQLLSAFNLLGDNIDKQGLESGFLQKNDEAQEEAPQEQTNEPVEAEVVE